VKYVDLSPEEFESAQRALGLPEWRIESRVGLYRECAAGRMNVLTDVVETVGKKQPATADQFARAHAQAFRNTGPPPNTAAQA
jgi:hypothetical protein